MKNCVSIILLNNISANTYNFSGYFREIKYVIPAFHEDSMSKYDDTELHLQGIRVERSYRRDHLSTGFAVIALSSLQGRSLAWHSRSCMLSTMKTNREHLKNFDPHVAKISTPRRLSSLKHIWMAWRQRKMNGELS